MNLSTDFSTFSAEDKNHRAFPYFMHAMKNRAFGGEALQDAWQWFKNGWMALDGKLQVQVTDRWCDNG